MDSCSNNPKDIQAVRAFRDAAVADGWSIEPTYGSESVERASRLFRDGYQMQIITRDDSDKIGIMKYKASIHIWAPDRLAVKPPSEYDFGKISAGMTTCSACRKTDVKTHRVGFAGRVCAECLPEQRRLVETPGWTN